MPKDYETLKKLGPDFDCGKCGNASCLAFIRRLTVGDEEIGTCPFIPDGNRSKMTEILSRMNIERKKEQVKVISTDQKKELPFPPADKEFGPECAEGDHTAATLQFSPCAEKEKVTLEVHLALPSSKGYSLLDSCDMCRTLSSMKTMDRVSCSQQMGYAAALLDGKRIHIFKNGKVIIRKADSKVAALDILKKFKIAMRPSVINNCGNTLSDSLLCDDQMAPECEAVLFWGVPPKLTKDYVIWQRTQTPTGTEDAGQARSRVGTSLPVLVVLREFVKNLKKSIAEGSECTKLGRETVESMTFLKELPGKMKEMMDILSSDEDYDFTELHSSALVFQNNFTALALERSMTEDEPRDLKTAFFGVVVHAMDMTVARSLAAVAGLFSSRESLREDEKKTKLMDDLFSSVFLKATTLLGRTFAVLVKGVTEDSDDTSSLLGEMRRHEEDSSTEVEAIEKKLAGLTEEFNTESLYPVFASLWKLLVNTRFLSSLLGKEIAVRTVG